MSRTDVSAGGPSDRIARSAASMLASLAILMTACGPSTTAQPSATRAAVPSGAATAAATERPVPGGRIVAAAGSDLRTMLPLLSVESQSDTVTGLIYPGLARQHAKTGEFEPYLAESVTLSPDSLTLTFVLRDGLVWSDGTPFTGEDFKYTVQAILRSAKTTKKANYLDIVGATDYRDGKTSDITGITVSGKTITVRFAKAFCPGALTVGTTPILPRHHFIKHFDPAKPGAQAIDDNPLNMAPPASMGPFTFKSYQANVRVTLVRNEKFFRGAPLVDEYVQKVYGDPTALANALKTGEASFGVVLANVYDDLTKSPSLVGYRVPSFQLHFIGWNLNSSKAPWLSKQEVRQALAYGLDSDAILNKLAFGLGVRQHAWLPKSSWAYDEAGLAKYQFDPKKARDLLEKAGARMGPDGIYRWTDGKPMQMRLATNSVGSFTDLRQNILQLAIQQYGEIGIKVEPLLEAGGPLIARWTPGGDWEGIILGTITGLPDPDMFSILHSQGIALKSNRGSYSNPQVDRAIEAARNGPDCTANARKQQYQVIERLISEELPYMGVMNTDTLLFVDKRVQGLVPGPYSTNIVMGHTQDIERWWIKR